MKERAIFGQVCIAVYDKSKWILSAVFVLAMMVNLNAMPRFTIRGDVLTAVEMHGETEAVIPDGVTAIMDFAFRDCYTLTSLTISESVRSIGGAAFSGCSNLASITFLGDKPFVSSDTFDYVSANCVVRLPRNNTTYGNRVNGSRWYGMTVELYGPVVANWTIDDGVLTHVELNGLTEVAIPDSVTHIRYDAFRDSDGLVSVLIPSSVIHIDDSAFWSCYNLASVIGVPQLALTDQRAFNEIFHGNRMTNVVIASGVTNIGDRVFENCNDLVCVTMPDSLTRIGNGAFASCGRLKNVTFGCGLTSVGDGAFRDCRDIEKIVIPESLVCIDADMFEVSSELVVETYDPADVLETMVEWTIRYGELMDVRLNGKSDVKVPCLVTRIPSYAFSDCASLRSVEILDGVLEIFSRAFERCTGLTNISVGAGNVNYSSANGLLLSKDGRTLVRGVNGDVTIPTSVTQIEKYAFSGCSGLRSVEIPDGVLDISTRAFECCTGLTNISVGVDNVNYSSANGLLLSKDGRTLIGGVNGDVTIPTSVTRIESSAFYGCSGLTSVTTPSSVTSIGDMAFYNCSGLTSVTIPSSVTSIGSQTFGGCSNLSLALVPSRLSDSISRKGVFLNCALDLRVVFYEGDADDVEWVVVSFDANGGENVPLFTIALKGMPMGQLPVPFRSRYRFLGWFTDAEGGDEVTVETVVEEDFTLYAHWKRWEFDFSGDADWAMEADDSWRSGTITHSQVCSITKNVSGKGVVTFRWKVSSESEGDKLAFSIDGDVRSEISGMADGWIAQTYEIHDDGLHALTWMYEKNKSVNGGLDCGWVREIVWVPAETLLCFDGDRIAYLAVADGVLVDVELSGATNVKIPNSVTRIGQEAFGDCRELTSVTIPDSVTSIGENAFRRCDHLESVTIGNGVTNIGNNAFYDCDVTSVTIPQYVCSRGLSVVFPRVAYWWGALAVTNVVILDGTTGIAKEAFSRLGLTSVTIPNSVTNIGDDAFLGCSELSLAVVPSRLREVVSQNDSFANCASNLQIEFYGDADWVTVRCDPNGGAIDPIVGNASKGLIKGQIIGCLPVPTHPNMFFQGWFMDAEGSERVAAETVAEHSITLYAHWGPFEIVDGVLKRVVLNGATEVSIPAGVTSIGEVAFSGCSGLTSVTIPSSVTSIERYAFSGCSGLTSVTIPEGVAHIGDGAFYNCSGLTSVTIPSSVTRIGLGAFWCCSGLKEILVSGDNSAYCSIDGILYNKSVTGLIQCPAGKNGFVTIPSVVTIIGDYAFQNCSGLTSVTIPSSVTSIGSYAFYDCSGLTSVTIPSSVTSIGSYAFYDCSGLTSVTIPSSVTSIGSCAFYGCSGLTEARISDLAAWCQIKFSGSLSNPLGYGAKLVLNGDDVVDLMIPSGVASIGSYAFYGCSGLTSVTIPSSVTSIGSYAFYGCSGLTSVTIPSSVTRIGDWAFYGCSGLTSVTIPSSVTTIGGGAFSGCGGLTSVTIPSSVTSIGNYAFEGCSGLADENGFVIVCGVLYDYLGDATSVTIPSSVASIGNSAFAYCSGLTLVTIPSSVTSIENWAFEECSGLTSVTIPSSVTSIGDYAFYYCYELATVYVGKGDAEHVRALYSWPSNVAFVEIVFPVIEGDEGATVTGDAETGFVIRPSEGKTVVEVSIPDGIDAGRVTVEVSVKVVSVKPHGAKVKVVNGGADITEFLNMPAADGNGVIDLAKATVKEEIVKEVLDTKKGAVVELNAANPTIETAPTKLGLVYDFRESTTLEGFGELKPAATKVGDGEKWSVPISVKGGSAAFYSIGVGKGE